MEKNIKMENIKHGKKTLKLENIEWKSIKIEKKH